MYWYVRSFLWSRHASSVESALSQDLNVLKAGEGIDGLVRLLRLLRGDLHIRPEDFWGWSAGNRFYPLLYILPNAVSSLPLRPVESPARLQSSAGRGDACGAAYSALWAAGSSLSSALMKRMALPRFSMSWYFWL